MSRFSNAGLQPAEITFVAAHARAAQYLDQAPILVMWMAPWVQSSEGRMFARTVVHSLCRDGVTLSEFLRHCGFPSPMRRIDARALQPSHASVYAMLGRMSPAVLGRIIPDKVTAQRRWLKSLAAWMDRNSRRPVLREPMGAFEWAADRFRAPELTRHLASDLADFMNAAAFNFDWGLARAREEMDLWHARITLDRVLAGTPFRPDDVIDLGKHPDEVDVEPYKMIALRTPRALCDEGTAMRHCVGTYVGQVVRGGCHIISIQRNGERVATVELRDRKGLAPHVAQIRAKRNEPAPATAVAMANFYAAMISQGDKP